MYMTFICRRLQRRCQYQVPPSQILCTDRCVGYLKEKVKMYGVYGDSATANDCSTSNEKAVANFIEYLRIRTVHPEPNYDAAVTFLKRMAKELDLPCRVIEIVADRPIVLITWLGSDVSVPSILLNSHMDVVPVYPEHWKYDPFEAVKESNGDIYARGTQDMKCVGIQYIEAIKRLRAQGQTIRRTLHMSFVPDEEIGGHLGMEKFVHMEEFKNLNVGFALDEGLASPTEEFLLYYGERNQSGVTVTCTGNPGHGSMFIENNSGEKLRKVLNSFLAFRDAEEQRLNSDDKLTIGDVTTVNLTKIQGGLQTNIVPSELNATFDIRVTPTIDVTSFEERIKQWCANAGEDVTYKIVSLGSGNNLTSLSENHLWWKAFKSSADQVGIQLKQEIFPASTDSRYIRRLNIPAFGFSPMNNTPVLLHDHNEYLNEAVFLRGIDIYCAILPALANVKDA